MTGVLVLVTVVVGMCLMEAVHLVIASKRRRYWEHRLRVERTREQFAEARNELLRLARDGEVDINSETFRQLYSVQTFIMRRPDKYQEISAQLSRALLRHDGSRASWLELEAPNWSPRVRRVMEKTADGILLVILDYSRFRRTVVAIERRTRSVTALLALVSWLARLASRWLERIEARRNPGLPELEQAHQRMAQAGQMQAA